jgi:uncharacterized protein
MRLSAFEADTIKKAIHRRFGDSSRVILFGSRTDDLRRGGDIDLLVETPATAAEAFQHKLEALTDMQLVLGERKIDMITAPPPGIEDPRPIVRIARETGIPL